MKQAFLTRSRKVLALLVVVTMAVGVPARVYANPQGGVVSAGQATITVRPNIVDVHQQSDKAIIDWRSFDIDNGETTEFHQPNAAAIALNRVHSSQASVINGALKANGNVIVVNQNGVLFGRNARVDVNGLVATTADIDNNKFMTQSKLKFDKPGNPNAAIINQGQITAKESGLVGFVAPNVENDGIIAARLGRVHLAAGDKATVDFYGDGLMEIAVSDDVRTQLVKNTGTLSADGGTVALTAAAGSRIIASAIEVGGTVNSQSVGVRNGRIVIAGLTNKNHGIRGTVQVAGHLNASGKASGEKGGQIAVTGDKITIASTAKIDASGHAGGGDIKIGGALQGKGATPTASQLVVERGSSILNNATYLGNGGDTILWSDGATDFAGSINNRGGQFGGNGGFVEVSGKQYLGYRGTVDTRAPLGRIGTLLLDPANITISNALDSNVSGGTPFGSTGAATSNLNVGTLVGALGSSNVIISTATGTGGNGDITFVDPVAWNSGFSLTANADRHINVNAAITNSGSGGIFLNANTAGSIITVAAPISTGGAIGLSAAQDILVNAALNAGTTLNLTATNRDIISNASGVLTAGGNLTTASGRDTTFGANATSGGNVSVSAGRDITVAASRTLATGATNSMTLLAAGGSTAGTGNLTLNGNLSVGTGNLTLLSGINGTRPSWTVTGTNLLRQGATFGAVNISGFLNLTVNRALNSSGAVTLTGNNTNGAITVGATGSVDGTNVAFNSALNTTINGTVNATGTLGYTTGQDLVIASGASSTSTGNTTVTSGRDVLLSGSLTTGGSYGGSVTRDIIMGSAGNLSSTGALTLAARDITLANVNSGGNIIVSATRDLTTLASTTITPSATGNLTLNAAGGSTAGMGNLTLNGIINAGTGSLTLTSGINGTRPSWTVTGTNLLRQGATFGAISISGFLNFVLDRDLNSTGNVSLVANNTGGNITLNSGRTVSGNAITTSSGLDTTINGTINAGTTLALTSGRDLIIGATGATNSVSTTTATVTQDLLLNGTLQSDAGFTEGVTRDILMGATGVLDVVGNITLTGRDITLASVTGGGNIAATATRDLTTLAATTITTGPTGALTLYAANNVVTGTGNLTLNGILNPGTGALNLTSGVNGTRPNWTITNANLVPQSTFGPITITGFLDTVINRDLATTAGNGINITSFRDLTLGGGYTVTPGSTGALTLRAANAVVTGAGNLYINGNINAGSGTLTLLSGINGTRTDYTMNGSNFTRQGANWGIISINGFRDTTVDTDINSNTNITINSFRDLNVNATRSITSGAGGGISLTAANNVVSDTGRLNLNGTLYNGTGALTLTSGINGTRPDLTLDGVGIQRIGAAYGAITINGFQDTFINDNIVSNGNVTINSVRDIRLNAANSITTGLAGGVGLRAANSTTGGNGWLYLDGVINMGNGTLTLLSGLNGGNRQNLTVTTSNIVPINTNFGAVSITGFQDVVVDRNMTSTGGITISTFRDLTIAAGRTVTTSATGALVLTAANNSATGTGQLFLNGNIGAGSGGLTLTTGLNGATRSDWTATTTNLLQPGANFGVVSIQGFRDLTIDRDITSNGAAGITMLSYRDLNINAGNTVTTSANGAMSLRAAGAVVGGTGRLNILGNLGSGTGALTLLSGTNGGRPSFTATTTTLDRVGASFGATTISGFADFVVDRVLNTTGAISFASNTRTILQNDVTTTGASNIVFSNAVVIGEGANVNVSTVNRAITFSSTVDDTIGGADDNLTVNSGTATTTFTGAVNGIGLDATAAALTVTTNAMGATRAMKDVSLVYTGAAAAYTPPSVTARKILIRTTGATSNLTINAGRVLTASDAGDAIVLAAGQNFINNNGVGALVRTGGGRYIIYSTAPGSDTTGGLTYDERRFSCSFASAGTCAYNATTGSTPLVPATGNVFLYSMTPIVLVVIPQGISDIIYGAAVPNLTNYAYVPFTLASGYLNADDFANDVITGSINGQTNYTQGSGVGSYNISYLSGDLVSSLGYGFDYQPLNNAFNVLARHVTIDLTGTAGKVYNGNNTATLTGANYTINNIYSGDLLTLGVSNSGATYNDKNVGVGKTVTVNGLALTGAVAANYVLDNTSAVAGVGTITPRALTVTGVAPHKVYDGTANSSATLSDDRVGGDVLTITYGTALFGNKNVANGKTVTISGINVTGTDAGNYTFNTGATTTANITPRTLTVSATGINKIYNGNNVGTVTLGDDRVGGDVLTIGYGTALFGDKNVANGKALNVSGITVTGTDAGNYTFNSTTATTADITPRALTISATGVNRVYNGLTGATVTLGDNRVGGDVLTTGYTTADFTDKNVANGKTVNVSGITLGGTDAGNYTFNTTASTTANITPRALAVSATGINKIYNGTNVGTVTLGDNRVGGDVLTIGYGTALFGNKNVANGKALNVSGITVTGTDAGNYTFNTTAATTADITPRALTVSATGINKIYNGNNVGTVTLGDDRIGGDVLTIGYGTALFGDKNVANGKALNVSGITVTGTDSGNYTFNTTAATAADITPRALAIGAIGVNRVYDGTDIGTVTLTDNRVGGDVLTLGYGTALFDNKNVANGKTVNVSGITLGGTDAGNYTFNTTGSTTANITPRALIVSATGINKIYNGNNVGTVTLGDDRVGGDVLTIGYGTALFGDKNVANGKALNVSGITVTGTDAGNYTFNTTAATAADITPRALTITASGINKVYDGNANAAVTIGDDRVGGDVLNITYGSSLFPDKNVGNGRTVTVNGLTLGGADAGNYTFNTGTTTSADITPRALTITASGINKVYDGNAVAGVTLGDNRVGGDVLNITYGSSLFPDKNVGNGRTITVSGLALGGADAGNYTYNTSATTSADITPRALTIGALGTNRIYNGTDVAAISLNDDRVVGDVLVLGYGTALFGDKNVGNGKSITVNGITLGGADAGNYTFNTTAATSADITPRALTISASGSGKVYDGNANATVTLGDDRVGGDVLNITYGSSLFPDKNAGVNRTITVSGITLGGADAGNYTYNTSATTSATITKAALTVTAANQNIVYGVAVPGTTLSYLGFISGEGVGDLGTAPTVTSGVSGIVNAGTYADNYTVGGGVDGNYSFSYAPGTLTVGKRTLNVTANTIAVTYGTAVPGGTLSYSGFITGEGVGDLTSAPTVNSANSGIQNAGTYGNNYTVSGGSSTNYDFNYFSGDLVVNKKDLNITANNRSITYGTAVPGGTLTYSGFITGDGIGDLDVQPSVTSAQSGVVNAGTYTNNYTVSGGTDNNYTYHYAPGTLTVTPAGLNVTVNNQSITYGTVVPGTTITYSGFVNGDVIGDIDVLPTIYSANSGIVNAGIYTGNFTASGGADGNYTFNYIPGNLVVSQKALNVTAGNRTITYGSVVPGSTLSYSGFITGEGVGDLNSAPTIVSGQTGVAAAGTYLGNYTIVGGSADNYYFNFTPGNLIVSQRTLTVSALPQNIVYGTNVPVGSITYSGFASGEGIADLDVAPTLSSANTGMVNAGTYVNNYTVGGGVSSNYTFSYVPANLVVSQKSLSVVANGRTITYGTAVPGTTLTYSGFVPGQNATFLDTAPTVISGVSGTVNAGTYAGNYVVGGGVDTNYSFVYTHGTLQVNRATVNISVNNLGYTYGGPNSFAGYNVSGLQLGETIGSVTLSTNATSSAGGHWNVGTWDVVASNATGGTFNPANYTVNYADGTMSITPRALTVNATGIDRVYNGSDLASILLGDNRASGDALIVSYGDARFPNKNAGANRTITVTGVTLNGADAGNYTLVGGGTVTTTATITPRVLLVSASALNKLHDGNANATVTLTDNRLGGDVLSVGYASALFPDASAGTNRTVTVSGLALTGADAGNYSVAPSVTTTATIYSTLPPDPPAVEPPSTVIKVSQDAGSVVVSTTDDGIFATPSGGYALIYLPYDAPDENRWRNKPIRAGVGGVPIIEPTAWYGTTQLDDGESDSEEI